MNEETKEIIKTPEIQELVPSLIDPEKQVEFATRAARALTSIISKKAKKVIMNGEQYLEFEDWQTIARFYNITVGVEWAKEINREGKLAGFEAKANVYNAQGVVISSAEASCLKDEPNWSRKPEFQLKSMSQTRASAKALRNVLAWVVVLAGYKPTPAEEITDSIVKQPRAETIKSVDKNTQFVAKAITISDKCSDCQAEISEAISNFSQKVYQSKLCMNCQTKYKKVI